MLCCTSHLSAPLKWGKEIKTLQSKRAFSWGKNEKKALQKGEGIQGFLLVMRASSHQSIRQEMRSDTWELAYVSCREAVVMGALVISLS